MRNLYEKAQDVQEISPEELKEIDIKTGTIKTDYNDMVFKLLANEVKNTNNFKNFLNAQGIDTNNMSKDNILKNKVFYLTNLIKFRDKTAGPDELKKFYKRLFSASVLDKFESKKFNTFEYIREDRDQHDVDVLSILEFNLNDEPIYYVYSEEEQTYIQLLPEEILEKINGYSEKKGKKLLIEERSKALYEGEEY